MSRKTLLLLGAFLAFIVVALVCITVWVRYFAFSGGSFDYSGARITPDVIKLCPAYIQVSRARIIHVRNSEGMNGGQMTIQFELPANQLTAFLAESPFKDASLESKSIPIEFHAPSWLPVRRQNELESSKAFSSASVTTGRTHNTILIDRTRSDIYVIYLQSTS